GSKTHTITEAQMPTHKHGSNLRLEGAANGNILIDNSLYYATGVAGREIDELSDYNANGDSTYTQTAGSGNSMPIVQPSIVVKMWKRDPD
ncbi:MAG: phage baseplate protein, partial [Pseudohongiellaceae bacterium]